MTPAEEADALALLRAVCQYAGCEQPDAASATTARWSFRLGEREYVTFDLDILEGAFADTLLGAVLRRLRKDGWRVHGCSEIGWNSWSVWHLRDKISRGGSDPDHAVLAVASAMRDAWIIRTETKT